MTAAQAVDLRRPAELGTGTRTVHAFVRERVPMLTTDRPLGSETERLAGDLLSGALDSALGDIVRFE